MDETGLVLDRVREALNSEARIDVAHHPLKLSWDGKDLVIEGEVGDIAAKKLALERSAAVPKVAGIVDRLRVAASQPMGDDEVRDHVRDALLDEPALTTCSILARNKGQDVVVRIPEAATGTITISVADGVVTLDGDVPGLAQKRLAGVLSWWVPGTRDVVNGLGVTPPEADTYGELSDAVRIALEKDPFVNAEQIRVYVRNAVVTLRGLVPTQSERDIAEYDAWYVFGVDKVVNEIEVRA